MGVRVAGVAAAHVEALVGEVLEEGKQAHGAGVVAGPRATAPVRRLRCMCRSFSRAALGGTARGPRVRPTPKGPKKGCIRKGAGV